MGCFATLPAYSKPCGSAPGGIRYVLLTAKALTQIGADEVELFSTLGTITAVRLKKTSLGAWGLATYDQGGIITQASNILSGWADEDPDDPFILIDVSRAGASLTSEAQINDETGSFYYENTLVIPLNMITKEAALLLEGLQGSDVLAGVVRNDGSMTFMGVSTRARVTAAGMQTGSNFSDTPGYSVTLQDRTSYPIPGKTVLINGSGTEITASQHDVVSGFLGAFTS